MCRLDPEAHSEDSPTAFELATVNGHVKTFELLTAKLRIDSNSEWFQLAQVCMVTFVFHCWAQTNSLEFNETFQKHLHAERKDLKGCPFFSSSEILLFLWVRLLFLHFNSYWSGGCPGPGVTIGSQVRNSRSFLATFLQPR